MLPVRHKFSAISPRVTQSPFMQTHAAAFRAITGRDPSAFERATGSALWQAYVRLNESSPDATVSYASREYLRCANEFPQDATVSYAFRGNLPKAFQAVSAATGSGKSVGACALIAHLHPAPCAFVIQTVEECENVYRSLSKLLPGKVAVYTSLHRINASPTLTEQKRRELGLEVTRRWHEDEFKASPVVITTHERWKREIDTGSDLGVRLFNGKPRALVVVDEDPSLERVYVKQPEDVSRLASIFADVTLRDEARAVGFTTAHHAADALATIHNRMRSIKDHAASLRLYTTDIVTAEDVETLEALSFKEITERVRHLPPDERTECADDAWSTVDFLKAAAQGRVFYSRDKGGAFYAYALQIQVQPRTLILDGTADLNGMYAIGSHVSVAESERPNYAPLQLAFVNPPAAFIGKMKPDKLLRNRWTAEPYMRWFFSFLLEHTHEGEHVLIYAKDALLSYGIHMEREYNESSDTKPFETVYRGRRLHWCNFGRGRGSNAWKDCTVSFRLGDFHMKKAALLARIGSATGRTFNGQDLTALSSGRTRDPLLKLASDTHLIVATKQDAARICIRHLSDDGVCAPARLYLVDSDKSLMTQYQQRMFPGSKEYRVIDCNPKAAAEGAPGGKRGVSSVERLANLLLSATECVLTGDDIEERAGFGVRHIDRALSSPKVAPIVTAKGWQKSTRKRVGLAGKGYVLTRAA